MQNDEFKYKPTQSFWKIQKLIKEGLPKFSENQQKVFVIQGGQGAGKTVAILMLIIDALRRTKQEITICSAELSKVKRTVLNDFIKIMSDYNIFERTKFNKSESIYNYGTGHFVEFIGLDMDDVGKGRRRRIIYINEANKITLQQYTDISARADIVIIDYNPDGIFWGNDLINDFNFINLTYLDNEYLSENEIRNILAYKERGYINCDLENYDVPENIKNEFFANKWRVYGLGNIGSVEGRVFTHFTKCTLDEFIKIQTYDCYVLDWGKNDPFAICHLKYDRNTNTLYARELNYLSENQILASMDSETYMKLRKEDGGAIMYIINKLGLNKQRYLVCDSAKPVNIDILQKNGYEYAYPVAKPKGSIMSGISMLQSANIVYTNCSKNLEIEFNNYKYKKDRLGVIDEETEDTYNHLMDCLRYGIFHFTNLFQ